MPAESKGMKVQDDGETSTREPEGFLPRRRAEETPLFQTGETGSPIRLGESVCRISPSPEPPCFQLSAASRSGSDLTSASHEADSAQTAHILLGNRNEDRLHMSLLCVTQHRDPGQLVTPRMLPPERLLHSPHSSRKAQSLRKTTLFRSQKFWGGGFRCQHSLLHKLFSSAWSPYRGISNSPMSPFGGDSWHETGAGKAARAAMQFSPQK